MVFNFTRRAIENDVSYFCSKDQYIIFRKDDEGYLVNSIMIRIKKIWPEGNPFDDIKVILIAKTEVKVDFNISVFKVDKNGELVPREGTSKYKKIFDVNYRLLESMRNIEGAVREYIRKNNIDISYDEFSVEFDENQQYIPIGETSESVIKYIDQNGSEAIVESIKNFATKKELEQFYDEMYDAIENDAVEPVFEEILKKHQELLPLVIPSIDLIKRFQYNIKESGMAPNRIDAVGIDESSIPNLIELKRSNTILLDKGKKYRNNTYKPTSEFSGAIQQANMQRIHYILGANKPEQVIVKSLLLIGNKNKEFNTHDDKDALHYNFNTIRYNNKDTEIITYDELLNRIKNVIEKFK